MENGRTVVAAEPTPRAALRALKQPLYDTQEAPAAAGPANNLTYFNQPQGSPLNVSAAPKGLADTNLTVSGSLSSPMEADIWGFQMKFFYDTGYYEENATPAVLANFLDDLAEVYEAAVFKFRFGQDRTYLTCPLTKIPHGNFGLTGPVATADDAAAAVGVSMFPISNGESNRLEYFKFLVDDEPVAIDSRENFNATIEYPNGALGLTASGDQSRLQVFCIGVLYISL